MLLAHRGWRKQSKLGGSYPTQLLRIHGRLIADYRFHRQGGSKAYAMKYYKAAQHISKAISILGEIK